MSTVFVAILTMGAINFTILSSIAPLVTRFYGISEPGNVIRVAAFAFLIGPFGAIPRALLARRMEYKKSAIADWVQLVAFSTSSVVFALLGFSYRSMVFARLVSATVTISLTTYFSGWRPSFRFSWRELRAILSYGMGVHAKRLLDYAAQNGDNLVVGRLLGMTSLGFYDKAFSTMQRFLARMNTGGPGVMFRIFAIIHEEPERIRRAYQKVMMSASLLSFPIFAGLAVVAPQLMVVLFGQNWLPAAAPFRFLCFAAMLKLLNTYASSAIQATGQVWSEVWRQVFLVTLIIGGIFVLRPWGPTGAAAAVLLAMAVMSVLMHTLLRRILAMSWSQLLSPLLPPAICAAGVALTAVLVEVAVRAMIPSPAPLLLLLCQVPVAGLFAALFALFAPFSNLRALVQEVTRDLAPTYIRQHPWARAYWGRFTPDQETLSA